MKIRLKSKDESSVLNLFFQAINPSISRCFEKCQQKRRQYKFFALSRERRCQCGYYTPMKYTGFIQKDLSECNATCPGDASAKCGGKSGGQLVNLFNVYEGIIR